MKISKDAQRVARQLFRATVAEGSIDDKIARKIVDKVKETKPRNYLQILTAYLRLLRLESAKAEATIESAVKLDDKVAKDVIKGLKKQYGDDLTADLVVNEDLIGGLKVKVGSDVWDGSVRSRIERLAESF